MQEQAIPDILIKCANAALPVEVKRVRINPEQSGAGFDASLAVAAPAGGGMEGGEGGRGGRPGFDGGGGRDGGYGATMAEGTIGSGLAKVEIYGIVYIYNPPNSETLAVPGGDTAEVAASDATTAASL